MLRLKKKGFALINTIIITSLMMTLSYLMFSIIKNNIEITSIHYIDDDIFSMNDYEEDVLCDFMKILNKRVNNLNKISESDDIDIGDNSNAEKRCDNLFDQSFEEKNNGNTLIYDKSKDKLIVKISSEFNSLRIRELKYRIEDDKVILIPTSYFYDTNNDTDTLNDG
ncbi:MAG: hypothetical protein ACI398_03015 [Clostridium sp.]